MTSDADEHPEWDPDAVPGLAPPLADPLSEQILVVDGERFLVGEHAGQGSQHVYSYDWISGPNPGYGFSSSGPEQTVDDHVEDIRAFLSDIDPETGYLGGS